MGIKPLTIPATFLRILHLSLATIVLALVLRTWLLMGLIEPVTVAGSSMAPTLRGPFATVHCARCGHQFDVGTEFEVADVECLRCGYAENSVEGLSIRRGDALVVDRTAFDWRLPRRWEPIVFRSPENGQLTVKRVVGLPGETVELRDGDVWIYGQVATKSLRQMRAVRQLVHEEDQQVRRWQPAAGSAWQWSNGSWRVAPTDDREHWLAYEHPGATKVTNDFAYNAGLSRRLFPVRDFCLAMDLKSSGDGELAVRFDDGADQITWEFGWPVRGSIEFFAFDRRLQMFVNGKLIRSVDLDSIASLVGTATPFAIGAKRMTLHISNLRIYRDIYHASSAEESGGPLPMQPVQLKAGDLYVLGDNVPVSLDSRQWGPVPQRLLVGRPLGIR